jgi:hypothetical protein
MKTVEELKNFKYKIDKNISLLFEALFEFNDPYDENVKNLLENSIIFDYIFRQASLEKDFDKYKNEFILKVEKDLNKLNNMYLEIKKYKEIEYKKTIKLS